MAKKPIRVRDKIEVIYTEERWKLLKELREKALRIMELLARYNIQTIAHGSIARGDVTPQSDIDIVIPQTVSPFQVESVLHSAGFDFYSRQIVQATPWHSLKAHICLDEKTVVTFPLVKLREREWEFYKFGGLVTINELRNNIRVPGVDKRLILIEPTVKGHIESSIIGRESEVAKILGVSVDIIEERINVLLRRDKIGRTGVYLKRELSPHETFGEVLKKVADRDPIVRRRILEDEGVK